MPMSKIFIPIEGKTVIERVVATLHSVVEIERTVLLVRNEDRHEVERLGILSDKVVLASGGETRQESVRKGLESIREYVAGDSLVVVHDAARCMASAGLFRRCLKAAREHKAVSAAVRVTDSVKAVGPDGRVVESLDRSKLVYVQTPQVFTFDLLWKAHNGSLRNASDDASLVEAIHPVFIEDGERTNVKLTFPEDIEIARLCSSPVPTI